MYLKIFCYFFKYIFNFFGFKSRSDYLSDCARTIHKKNVLPNYITYMKDNEKIKIILI